MIGPPPRICCFDGDPAELSGMFGDHVGRVRFVCRRHEAIPVEDRIRMLLRGETPP